MRLDGLTGEGNSCPILSRQWSLVNQIPLAHGSTSLGVPKRGRRLFSLRQDDEEGRGGVEVGYIVSWRRGRFGGATETGKDGACYSMQLLCIGISAKGIRGVRRYLGRKCIHGAVNVVSVKLCAKGWGNFGGVVQEPLLRLR